MLAVDADQSIVIANASGIIVNHFFVSVSIRSVTKFLNYSLGYLLMGTLFLQMVIQMHQYRVSMLTCPLSWHQ
jgi:hypothetical protein